MNKLRFRSVPGSANDELPFRPDENSFSEWLESLLSENNYEICSQLTRIIGAMNKTELNPGFRFKFLCHSLPIVDEVSERLERVYVDSGFPLTGEEISNVEILVWTYAQLTMSFSDLSYQLELDHINWNAQQKAQILYLAMYAASQVLLHVSQVYSDVPKGFWLNCYRNYLRAETNKLLNVPVTIAHFKDKTIDGIFKQMLIFSCCDTDCFRVREMNTLYSLLSDCSELISLSNKLEANQRQAVFRLNIDRDECPKKDSQHYVYSKKTTFYLDALPVVNYLIEKLQPKKNKPCDFRFLDKALIAKIAEILTKEHHRKYTRLTYSENAKGFIGLKPIVSMLAKLQEIDNESLISQIKGDPRIAGNWEVPNFDLVPEGDEIAYGIRQKTGRIRSVDPSTAKIQQLGAQALHAGNIWDRAEPVELLDTIPYGEFLILNNSVKGYALLWKPEDMRIRVGELFAVQPEGGKRLEIGLVRRINRLENDGLKLGIELMGMQSELVWLVKQGASKQQGQMAIFIPINPILRQPNSIVFDSPMLKPEQSVEIYRSGKKNRYRLGRLMHVSATIQHFELVIMETGSR